MSYEVVVVGGGIGGLTTAALLAARGVSVCLLEKEPEAGGCAAAFEHSGHSFETGAGLYASWQPGEIHERVFGELPVEPPLVRRVSPAYVVRLPDGTDMRVGTEGEEFAAGLRAAFPECAEAALRFYGETTPLAEALHRAAARVPSLATAPRLQRLKLLATEARLSSSILSGINHTAAHHLEGTSARFRYFIDAQLQIFAQAPSDSTAHLYAAVALSQGRRGMYAIRGGAAALVAALVESIRLSGGMVRLDAPVLRLAHGPGGVAAGVSLLSGEVVEATRAVVSNLTVWDTYGKLLGSERTPPETRARLKGLRGWGAYQMFLSADEEAARRLPADQIISLTDWHEGADFDPERSLFMFSAAPAWDARAPAGKRAVTVSTFTDAAQWFTFHEDETGHEEQDRRALAERWGRMHAALPELGAGVEVIETATPRVFYERTRRRLGMVGGVGQALEVFGLNAVTHRTSLPNLYMVG
ncbi:MAG: FAD-dependent oxidoreductase, partial [Acidobacteria bacterium]|nr:FAD-dependent oxidoreductase [Acidobacteriota bacterium]